MSNWTSLAIIGAGPYGLSLAAHLRDRNVDFRIFGNPMSLWTAHMPQGMQLKSEGDASNLYEPAGAFTLKAYCRERGIAYQDSAMPVDLDTFCQYGLEFQKRFVPQLEVRQVRRVSQSPSGFNLLLDDGQVVVAGRVVVAVGVGYFAHMPECLAGLPAEYCSHSGAHSDLSSFRGRDILVVGGGASAVDIAVLLHEAGASVRLMARAPALDIHQAPSGKPRPLWQQLRHPRTGIGNSLRSWLLVKAPLAFHHLPEPVRLRITRRHLGPAAGWFMRERLLSQVPTLLGCSLRSADLWEGRVHLTCHSATEGPMKVSADHIVAATGYRVEIQRMDFLDQSIRAELLAVEQTPILNWCFESSIPGLHFVGPAAANSFGPVMRFAYGAGFAARHLSAYLRSILSRPVPGISGELRPGV